MKKLAFYLLFIGQTLLAQPPEASDDLYSGQDALPYFLFYCSEKDTRAAQIECLQDEIVYYIESRITPDVAPNLKGNTEVRFIVEKDGSILHVEIVKSLNPVADAVVEQMFLTMPKWIPAYKDSEPVRYILVMELSFQPKTSKFNDNNFKSLRDVFCKQYHSGTISRKNLGAWVEKFGEYKSIRCNPTTRVVSIELKYIKNDKEKVLKSSEEELLTNKMRKLLTDAEFGATILLTVGVKTEDSDKVVYVDHKVVVTD